MVSQFVSTDDVRLLGDLDYDFPEGTHAIGRLDSHSEGLLILTTNKRVTSLLFQGEKPPGLMARYEHEREDVPHTWLLITLTEGKYHQVRKMVRTAGHRCKRLIRVSIEALELGDLPAGAVREVEETEFFEKLRIDNWR